MHNFEGTGQWCARANEDMLIRMVGRKNCSQLRVKLQPPPVNNRTGIHHLNKNYNEMAEEFIMRNKRGKILKI